MGSRILLADDSITIQKVVNLTFADEGIEVVAVSNGDVAERRLNEVKPDLVLADIFMPGKNGYELCEAIKQNPQFRNVPVVLLVGAFEPFDQAEARRVRADAHLTKPFESRTLVETVRRLISATGRTTGPIAQMPSPGDVREEKRPPDPLPPLLTNPTATKLDLSEMMVDRASPPPASAIKNTGELASSLAGAQMSDVAVMDIPAQEPMNAGLADAPEHFDLMEMPPIGEFAPVDIQSSSGHDESDMILDFDRQEPSEASAPLDSVSFETQATAPLDVDVSASGNGAGLFSSLEGLEIPSNDEPAPASTTTPGLGDEAPDLRLHSEPASPFSEASDESESATVLAGEEPLGDVLFDETVSAGMLAFSQDSLDIDLTEHAAIEAPATGATQFDLVEPGDDSLQTSEAVENNSEELDLSANQETVSVVHEPDAASDATATGYAADSQPGSAEAAVILDWTSPGAGKYSTAQLDSVIMPFDTAEYLTENPPNNGARQDDSTEEASFEKAQMWPEEEAHFTAIDIEAFPVEDTEPLKPAPDQLQAAETGFSFSPVAGHTTPAAEARAGNDAPSEATTNGAPSQAELSADAIDEIVRRVVAEMSESVVREVAWEVVPDCVERVIDQLTRESLSKRA